MDTKTVKVDFSQGRPLVIGDLHGAHLALKQCLERWEFDHGNGAALVAGDNVVGLNLTDTIIP